MARVVIKQQLKTIARALASWPIVGRIVRIGIAVIRLPDGLAASSHMNSRPVAYENLLISVPVALRNAARNLTELQRKQENLATAVDSVTRRIEFVRQELMLEIRYGDRRLAERADATNAKTEITNQEQVAAARRRGHLRLNLGCGHIPLEGYLNIDKRALPRVDIVTEADALPFEPGEVDEIFSAHFLEHFPEEELQRKLLPYWVSLLKPGGTFRAVVPDAEAMIRGYVEGTFPYSSLREVTFGGQDYDGDFHFNMFIPAQLETLLAEAGLVEPKWIVKGRKNGLCYEMEIRSEKRL